ncbi:MAG: secretion system protein F [Chloroflexi bacterium B3_Chlor]|nr:MAG: secretion system protein F [Chloroflexi bacterium B3_Chlor]
MVLVLPLLAGGSILTLFLGLSRVIRSRSRVITRLGDVTAAVSEEAPKKREEGDRPIPEVVVSLDRALARQSFAKRVATDLARANLKLTVAEFVLLTLGIIAAGAIMGAFLVRQLWIIGAVAGAVLGFIAPRIYLRVTQGRRLNAFNDQLGDTITLLANSLRSGYSLLQSMEMVARELPPPMSEEFGRVTREIGLGVSNQEALNNLLRRITSDDLDMMITAINIHHEVGGNLSEILDTIGHTIRERVRIKGEIRTLTSMARYSGYIVTILPVAVAGLLFVMSNEYMSKLWQDPCGLQMIGIAAVGMFLGWIVIRRIVNIEV